MEAIFQRLEKHMTFICPECGDKFEQQQQWRQHLNFDHDYLCKTPEDFGFVEISDRYHECLECNQLVADGKRAIALLQYHRFVHLPHKCTYSCRHCSGTFMRKRLCFNHLCRAHEKIVGKQLSEAALKSPMLSIRKDIGNRTMPETIFVAKQNPEFYLNFICPQCGCEINKHEDWLRHIEAAHSLTLQPNNALVKVAGSDGFLCTICHKNIYNNDKEKHQRHYFMHLPHKLMFRCAYCSIKRPFKTEIMHHFMTTHLLIFEKQRIFMCKPKEFGFNINKKFERELDVLLKYGNKVGAPQGSVWSKPSSLTPVSRNTSADKNNFMRKANMNLVSSTATSSNNIKKELDALCAEIFKDIEDDETIIEDNMKSGNGKSEILHNDYLLQDDMENMLKVKETKNTVQEEVVSIEIDTIDENELDQIIKNDEATRRLSDVSMSAKPLPIETYSNLKSFYNAKVLHLCPQCGIPFAEQSSWRSHVLNTHENLYNSVEQSFKLLDEQSNLCLTCNRILHTTTKTELQRHRFTHMPFSAYLKCTLCEECEINKPQMFEHLEKHHANYLADTNEIEAGKSNHSNNYNVNVQSSSQISKDLLIHLRNARERLNRMAKEYGIVQL